jgi:hypothetical protein
MNRLHLIAWLGVLVPVWSVLGALSTLESYFPWWWGALVGAVIGVFASAALGGNRKWKIWDLLYGTEQEEN